MFCSTLLSKRCENISTPLRTAAQQLSVAGMKKARCITTEDWPWWTLGGSETKQKRMECDWSCFYSTPVSALSSRCEWHGLASCWNVNRHATHTPITPNNLLHCYLHFNSQLSVRSYSVAPHNPCVLFSLLWQARVRFHLLPLLACDRVVKNLPEAGGIKAYWNVYDLQISLSRHQVYFLLNSLLQLLISRAALNLRAQKDTDFQRTGNLVNRQNVLCILHNSLENLFLIG